MILYQNQIKDFPKLIVAGVDEAGRGPIAGPVVVAATILDENQKIKGLNDSKKISEKKRERLFEEIIAKSRDFKIVFIEPQKIDKLNILQATLLGMRIAVQRLEILADICLIDGNQTPLYMPIPAKTIVKGDGIYAAIAAASILAKVSRDRFMRKIHQKYPQYDFIHNKGYPTASHIEIVKKIGISPYHRKSFRPVSGLVKKR